MALNIKLDKKYYKSDSIENGRLAAAFFSKLARNVFNATYKHYSLYKEYTQGNMDPSLPLLEGERNLYSIFASAIDKITPVHLSEWSFSKKDNPDDLVRRVDFWCCDKPTQNSQPINYFIEIKKGWYCLNEGTTEEMNSQVNDRIEELLSQISTIKKIKPVWHGDNVYIGIIGIYGYYKPGKEYYDETQIRENIHCLLDKRQNAQLILSTWTLPEHVETGWRSNDCMFITLAGIVITKKKS